jgi:DNA integrity scanning protein DisA with diadenylate cyclase activity
MKIKEKLQELTEGGLRLIPPIFWRFNGKNRQIEDDKFWTLWLMRDKFGIKRNSNVIYKDDRGFEIRQFKTFFANPIKFSKADEDSILEEINNYLMFNKQHLKTLEARDIVAVTNLEVRRELLRDFGYERFVNEMKGIVINKDKRGELIKLQVRKEEPMKFVKVKDSSTDREYIIRVPPNMKTCTEALAWTFSMSEQEYRPEKET